MRQGTVVTTHLEQRRGDTWLRVKVPNITPPPPRTGLPNPQCYLASSLDCSRTMSGEHYVSESVIKALGGEFKISGFPWQDVGQEQVIGINSLRSKVLCKRHNEAFSPIDEAAKKFFGVLYSIIADISGESGDRDGTDWYLVSGEMLELWLTKTLFGLYPKIAAKGRIRLSATQTISVTRLRRTVKRGRLLPPDGLYMEIPTEKIGTYEPKLNLAPLSVFDQEVVGLRWSIFGFAFDFAFDTSSLNMEPFKSKYIYRPDVLRIKKSRRCHAIISFLAV